MNVEAKRSYEDLEAEAMSLLEWPLDLIREVLVRHTAVMLEELRARRKKAAIASYDDDKRQRELAAALQVAVFDFDAHDPAHAKTLLFEAGWIAGAYHARKSPNANSASK